MRGCAGWVFVSETAQVELKGGRVQAPARELVFQIAVTAPEAQGAILRPRR